MDVQHEMKDRQMKGTTSFTNGLRPRTSLIQCEARNAYWLGQSVRGRPQNSCSLSKNRCKSIANHRQFLLGWRETQSGKDQDVASHDPTFLEDVLLGRERKPDPQHARPRKRLALSCTGNRATHTKRKAARLRNAKTYLPLGKLLDKDTR